ncbi:MAG: glycerol-3-phosphate dehydrogenase/oxidase [Planctomycetes bacterium]|nr:glycerol-3-phosphate dehydrogenase/oxidase [Planctomycetota bacterium]
MYDRPTTFRKIEQKPDVPVLILGGGVNGVGLFRELALQGVECLLVDKADFVAGASSKASRMIHGGLRYLECREFRLVRESLIERNRLLDNAPHYVTPQKTTIPLFSWLGGAWRSALIFAGFDARPGGRGALLVKLGLSFYDFVTRKSRRTPRHFFTSKKKSLAELPGLNPRIKATATYWDAQISEAERLCIEMLDDACHANDKCLALNYVRPERVEGGTIVLRDEVTGRTATVRPRIVVNATGAWVDKANATLGLKTRFMGGTKGSHLVVDSPELAAALGDRMVYYEHSDGRICIAIPFRGKVLMGSTDIRIEDPDEARCDEAEVAYMLATLRGVFPAIEVRRGQIVCAFCGVRPLPASAKGVTATITRGHSIRVIEPEGDRSFPVFCLIGGKWTTFRAFAEEVADQLLGRLGVERRCSTRDLAIGGGRSFPPGERGRELWLSRLSEEWGVSRERLAVLLARYGTNCVFYVPKDGARADTPLKSLPDYTVAEIERIAAAEHVVHLADLIFRRSTIALRGLATPAALAELAGVIGRVLAWDERRREEEVRRALEETTPPTPSTEAVEGGTQP